MRRLVCADSLRVSLTDSNGSVEHWHLTSGKCLHAMTNDQNQLYALDYRADGAMFATAGKDQSVRPSLIS